MQFCKVSFASLLLVFATWTSAGVRASFFGGTEHVHVRIHVPVEVVHHETQKEVHYHHHTAPAPHHQPASHHHHHQTATHSDVGHYSAAPLQQHHHHTPTVSHDLHHEHQHASIGGLQADGYTYMAPVHQPYAHEQQQHIQHEHYAVGQPVTLTGIVLDDGRGGHSHSHQHHSNGLSTVTGVVIGEEALHGHVGHSDTSSGLGGGYGGHAHEGHHSSGGYDFSAVQNAFKSAQQSDVHHGFAPSFGGGGAYDSGHSSAAPHAAALYSHQHSEQQHEVYGVPATHVSSGGGGGAGGYEHGHHNAQQQHSSHGYAVTDAYADSFAGSYDSNDHPQQLQHHDGGASSHHQQADSYIAALDYSSAEHGNHLGAGGANGHHDDSYTGPDSYSAAPSGAQPTAVVAAAPEHHQSLPQLHYQRFNDVSPGYDYPVPTGGATLHH